MQRTRFYSSVSYRYFTTHGKQRNVPKHEIILNPFQDANDIYYIESGFVKVYSLTKTGSCNLLLIYSEGESFPVQSFTGIGLDDEIYYEAKTGVSLWKVSTYRYVDELQHNAEFLFDILTQTHIMVEIYRNTIESLQYRTLREQLISKLLFLGWRFGSDNLLIDAPITHQDLADYLGASREAVSRTMKCLMNDNLIKYHDHRIIIKDRQRLMNEL